MWRGAALLFTAAVQAQNLTEMIETAKSGELALLTKSLSDPAVLRRIDPVNESGAISVTGSGRVFEALRANGSSEVESLCVALSASKEFTAVPARINFLLGALGTRKRLSAGGIGVVNRFAREGFLEPAAAALARQRGAEALAALESILADDSLDAAQRAYAVRGALVPNRNRMEFVRMAGRLVRKQGLSAAVTHGAGEGLFDYQPRAWQLPPPPARNEASAAVRKEIRAIAAELLGRRDLPVALKAAIQAAMVELR